MIPISNNPDTIVASGPILGPRSSPVTEGVKLEGEVPSESEFTIENEFINVLATNPGGSDMWDMPIKNNRQNNDIS